MDIPLESPFLDSPLGSSPVTNFEISKSLNKAHNQEKKSIPEEVTSESKTENREELVVIVIELEKGHEVPIVVYYGDDAEELANTFASKYKLSSLETLKLKQNIQININKALNNYRPRTKPTRNYNKFLTKNTSTYNPSLGRKSTKTGVVTKTNELELACENKVRADKSMRTKNSQLILDLSGKSKRSTTPDIAMSVQRLYSIPINKKKEAEKLNEMKKKKKELEEQQWSFRPQIDPLSKKIANDNQKHSKVETRLGTKNKDSAKKRELIKDSQEQEEKLNCPFKPNINKKSSQLANNRNQRISTNLLGLVTNSNETFELLFEDAKRRKLFQANTAKYAKQEGCTFHPNIDLSQRVTKGTSKKKKSMRKVEVEMPQYKPKTGRAPKITRNEENIPIGTYLYLQGRRKESMKFLMQKELITKQSKSCNKSFVQEESNRLLENKKRSKIDSIFKELDQDFDGIISGRDVSADSILSLIDRIT